MFFHGETRSLSAAVLFVDFFCFVFAHQPRAVFLSLGFAGFGARFAISGAGVALGFAEALDEADWSAGEIPFFADLIFEEALVAEVERIFLVGEEQECRRRRFRLDEIIDFNRACFWRRAALEIDFFLEPAIQFGRGNTLATRGSDLIDQRKQLGGAVAGFCREKNDRRVAEEFQLVADEFFVVEEQAALVLIAETVDPLRRAGVGIFSRTAFMRAVFAAVCATCGGAGFACFEFRARLSRCAVFRGGFSASIVGVAACLALARCGGAFGGFARGFDGEIPLVHDDDDAAAGLLGVVCDLRVTLRDALFGVYDEERDVGALEATARHDDAELFGDECRFAFSANAGGVDEIVKVAVVLNLGVH